MPTLQVGRLSMPAPQVAMPAPLAGQCQCQPLELDSYKCQFLELVVGCQYQPLELGPHYPHFTQALFWDSWVKNNFTIVS